MSALPDRRSGRCHPERSDGSHGERNFRSATGVPPPMGFPSASSRQASAALGPRRSYVKAKDVRPLWRSRWMVRKIWRARWRLSARRASRSLLPPPSALQVDLRLAASHPGARDHDEVQRRVQFAVAAAIQPVPPKRAPFAPLGSRSRAIPRWIATRHGAGRGTFLVAPSDTYPTSPERQAPRRSRRGACADPSAGLVVHRRRGLCLFLLRHVRNQGLGRKDHAGD